MIAIPFKISRSCSSFYEGEQVEPILVQGRSVEFNEKLLQLCKLRDSLCSSIVVPCDSRETSVDQKLYASWKSYYAALGEFQQCFFPSSEDTCDIPNLKLTWDHAFDSGHETHSDFSSERTCVLFTLAALQSGLAKLYPTDCNGLTKASEHYNLAAGIIDLLLQQPQKAVHSIDTCRDNLEFMQHLMLAQSQACKFFTAKNMSQSPIHCLLATFSMGCAELYQKALSSLQSTSTPLSQKIKMGAQWENYINAKHFEWLAIAEYHKGVDLKESAVSEQNVDSYGAAFAWISAAKEHMAQALLHAQQCQDNTMFQIEGLKTMQPYICQVWEEMAHQKEDSSGKFFEAPSPPELDTIVARVLSKAALEDELESYYIQRMIQQATELVGHLDFDARTTLSRYNLPQGISSTHSPEDLWHEVNELQESNGISKLRRRLLELSAVAELARERATQLRDLLDADLQFDRDFRQRHPLFSEKKVEDLQIPIRNELKLCSAKLEESNEVDAANLKMLDMLQTDPKFIMLNMSRQQIEKLVPNEGKVFDFDTSHLEYLLTELSTLIGNRDEILSNMRKSSSNPAIQDMFEEIKVSSKQQQPLLQNIILENNRFVEAQNSATIRWKTSLAEGLKAVKKATAQVEEGHTFYTTILELIAKIHQRASHVSAEMIGARCDFEEIESAKERLIEDAKVAAQLNMEEEKLQNTNGSDSISANSNVGPESSSKGSIIGLESSHRPWCDNNNSRVPGVCEVSHHEPRPTIVKDEHVALLVDMNFSPDQAVKALARHDNNIQHALDDLLRDIN